MRAFGNLMNRIQEGPAPTPSVGDGATVLFWSERHAATVIEVLTPKKIVVQRDIATRTDKNGMSESQSYSFAPNPAGEKWVVTQRRNGQWVVEGESMRNGTVVSLGSRSEYYDYSF